MTEEPTQFKMSYERSITSGLVKRRLNMTDPELLRVVMDWPSILTYKFDTQLEPRMEALQQRLSLSDDELKSIVLKAPTVLKCEHEAVVGPRISTIQSQLQLGPSALTLFILRWPMVLSPEYESKLEEKLGAMEPHFGMTNEDLIRLSEEQLNRSLTNTTLGGVPQTCPVSTTPAWKKPVRYVMGLTWVGAIAYAVAAAPGSGAESLAHDLELAKLAFNPLGDGNPLFYCVFSALGILPSVYMALLLPGANKQPIPAATLFSGFALGYGGVAPYMATRRERPALTQAELGPVAKHWYESKIKCAAPLGAMSLALAYKLFTIADVAAASSEFGELFMSSKLVHVSTLDLIPLSLFFYEPAIEDMKRRGWWPQSEDVPPTAAERTRLLSFCALPVLGPAFYVLLRPRLPPGE